MIFDMHSKSQNLVKNSDRILGWGGSGVGWGLDLVSLVLGIVDNFVNMWIIF
jgi:hypothetical protein